MGGSSSSHGATAARAQAAAARAAAAAAQEQANAAQKALEEQRMANERRLEQQRQAQKRAAEEARQAQLENQRRLEAAEQQRQKEAAAAARREEEQRQAAERVREQARREQEAAARRLEEERARRVAEAEAAALRLEEERVAAEARCTQELEAERARVHEEKVQAWRALNREYPIPQYLEQYISRVLDDAVANAAQERFVNIGLFGDAGTGKSSLISAILERFDPPVDGEVAGRRVRPRSCFEGDGTRVPTPYKLRDSVWIWDLPGKGTHMFPSQTYIRDMGLKYFDAVLVTTDGRWSETDGSLLQAISFADIWYTVVRTKVDQAVEDAKHDDPPMTQEETLEHVHTTLMTQLHETDPDKTQLVTVRRTYWVGGHGGLQFGMIDQLCTRVVRQVEMKCGIHLE